MTRRALLRGAAAVTLVAGSLALSHALRAQSDDAAVPRPPAKALPPPVPSTPTAVSTASAEAAKVTITISVYPSRKATVAWGKKQLGVIKPRDVLIVQRPRDSGPLDLVINADGFLPVQTRAFTFSDSKLVVRLTAIDQKATLLGYREELPEGGVFDVIEVDAGTPSSSFFP